MAGELLWLTLTAGLILLLWVPYILAGIAQFGMLNAMTMANDQSGLPVWAKRSYRSHMNLVENLAPFAVLVLVLNITGKADGASVTACAVFFFTRLAHALIYIAGIPYLRTLSFATGWAACLFLLWQAIN